MKINGRDQELEKGQRGSAAFGNQLQKVYVALKLDFDFVILSVFYT